MSKTNGNNATKWNKVTAFIKTTSIEGLRQIMSDISAQNERFTPEQYEQISTLIDKDDLATAAAKVAAAAENGVTGYDEVLPLVNAAPFAVVKRFVHNVDTRLKSLPPEQQDECLGGGIDEDSLASLMASLPSDDDGYASFDDMVGPGVEDEGDEGEGFPL